MTHSRKRALTLLLLAMLTVPSVRAEELVVIVNPTAGTITKQQLADLYLGRGGAWIPVDQSMDSAIYAAFYNRLTGRDVAQVRAIWSKVLFTGRGLPPKQLADSEAVKKAVSANPKVIGYIERSALDASVKIALSLD